MVESEVTSRRLGKMAGKGSIGAQGCSFQRLKRLRQSLSVRVEAKCDLSRQSGEDSMLVGSNFWALPCEATALSSHFWQVLLLGNGSWGPAATGDISFRVKLYLCAAVRVDTLDRFCGGGAPVEQIPSKREILDSKSSVEMGRGPAACGRAPLDSSVGHQGLASAQQLRGAGASQARLFWVCYRVADPPFGNSRNRSAVLSRAGP